jgi:hypothetical protein
MNEDIKGQWKQVRGKARNGGARTNDDLDKIDIKWTKW